jgi:putative transposase
MIRAHKTRLNPTPEQEIYLKKACGTARFTFNWGLARWKEAKAQGVEKYGAMALKKEFNAIKREQFPWTLEVTKNAVEDGFRRLSAAMHNYYDSKGGKRKGEAVDFPNFKSKRGQQSVTLDYERFKVDGHWLSIQKLPTPINMAEQVRLAGKMKWATISCDADRWYVSFSVEFEQQATSDARQAVVGIDLGVKTLATLSDGTEFENQKLLRSELAHGKRLARRLSRRQEGSNRWRRAKLQLARFHQQIANRRLDAIHKLTTQITRTYAMVVVEDLNVKGMGRNRRLALSMADAALGEVLRQLAYKAQRLVKVGRFYASSKTCSDCGHVNRELKLSDRKWVCASCGVLHERDWNASKNILHEGLRLTTA